MLRLSLFDGEETGKLFLQVKSAKSVAMRRSLYPIRISHVCLLPSYGFGTQSMFQLAAALISVALPVIVALCGIAFVILPYGEPVFPADLRSPILVHRSSVFSRPLSRVARCSPHGSAVRFHAQVPQVRRAAGLKNQRKKIPESCSAYCAVTEEPRTRHNSETLTKSRLESSLLRMRCASQVSDFENAFRNR